MSNDPLETAIQLVRGVYGASSNADRARLTQQLMDFEASLDAQTALRVGTGLLQSKGETVVVQQYGAVILRKSIFHALLMPSDVPLLEIFLWYCADSSVTGVLMNSLLDLIGEIALRESPNKLVDLLVLCDKNMTSEDQLMKKMRTLSHLVVLIMECMDDTNELNGNHRHLQKTLREQSTPLVQIAIGALEAVYLRGATPALNESVPMIVEDCTCILRHLSHHVPLSVWEQKGSVKDCLLTLLAWPPARANVVHLSISAVSNLCNHKNPDAQPMLLQLFQAVIEALNTVVVDGSGNVNCAEMIDEFLQCLKNVKRHELVIHACMDAVTVLLTDILLLPSFYMATEVCGILSTLGDEEISKVNLFLFCERLFVFIQKKCHGHPVIMRWAEGEDEYDKHFQELRRNAERCLTKLSQRHPEESNRQIRRLIQQLPNPSGREGEPRTPFGSVTQQSQTFAQWDASCFMIEHLCHSFSVSDVCVEDSVQYLLSGAGTVRDPVLRPSYLHILSLFWQYERHGEAFWKATLDVLFSEIENTDRFTHDEDAQSLCRYACKLVKKAAESAARYFSLVPYSIERLQPLLLKVKSRERTDLYAALSLLCMSIDPEQGKNYYYDLMNPILVQAEQIMRHVTSQAAFDAIVLGISKAEKDRRMQLNESLSILCSLDGYSPSPFMEDIARRTLNVVKVVSFFIFNMNASSFPPPYNEIQLLSEREWRPLLDKPLRSGVDPGYLGEARTSLTTTRFSVVKLQSILLRLLPEDEALELFNGWNSDMFLSVPVHWMKKYCRDLLIVVAGVREDALLPVLHIILKYFACEQKMRQLVSGVSAEEESVIRQRSWHGFAMMIEKELLDKILDGANWTRQPEILCMACRVTAEMGGSVPSYNPKVFLKRVMELKRTDVEPNVLHEIRLCAFECACQLLASASRESLNPSQKQMLCNAVAPFLLENFFTLQPVLSRAGYSVEEQSHLHRLLSTSTSSRQHAYCKDFLMRSLVG